MGAEHEEDAAYRQIICDAYEAARSGAMPGSGVVVALRPGHTTTCPARFLLLAVERARTLRAKFGDEWNEAPEGEAIAGDIATIANFWQQERGRYAQ
jgi:hypothetical protein